MTKSPQDRLLPRMRWRYLLVILMLIPVGVAQATTVSDLYEAEVPVQGQGAEQRKQAIQAAFIQMLIKVTGNRNIGSRSELKAEIPTAQRYVQQYRYRLAPDQTDVMTDEPTRRGSRAPKKQAQRETSRMLGVTFDEEAVNRLLRERRLPVWNKNRPSTLLWLGLEQNRKRRHMSPDRDVELKVVLKQAAQQRGLSLLFPLMDLEDQSTLQIADLWGSFEPNIRKASQRYRPDLIISTRLTQVSAKLWRADWSLYQTGQVSDWSNEGQSRDQVTTDGLQQAADMMARRLAPMKTGIELQEFRIKVSGIDNLRDYAKVTGYLRSQSLVGQIRIALVEPEAVTYAFSVTGTIHDLDRSLRLSGMIEPDTDIFSANEPQAEDVDLYYKLNR